ncbi:YdbL family protein [Pseudoalteromonas sp. BDTF-M6]|uniref:YdbL family protein n=1 Tax=Pseudoalteromonas sp. BDTF-M6 TaxID=2796132 RepID=UPI001BAF7E43|nr:YdbL family protein [Pseudoalteromonas sp. BDTF-M6]MBS3798967.1 YdbL family protein [Pseudoalteromonas sp. BDTF-M6]
MKLVKWTMLLSATMLAFSAWALTLDQAKAQGIVGETSTGYLALVQDSAEAQQLITEINAKRKAKYLSLAKKNGISLSQVEALAGAKAIEKTAPGHMVKVDGKWRKK